MDLLTLCHFVDGFFGEELWNNSLYFLMWTQVNCVILSAFLSTNYSIDLQLIISFCM